MNRRRVVLGLQIAASLGLAGLGHHYLSALRDEFPADGLIFYAAAALMGWLAWRTLSREPDLIWSVLRDSIRAALGVMVDALRVIGATLRDVLPVMPARAIAVSVIGLNVVAALIAWLVPAARWLWQIGWTAALLIVVLAVWARWNERRPRSKQQQSAAAITRRVIAEDAAAIDRRVNPIGLISVIGLLIAGQLMIGNAAQSTELAASPIAESLRLGLPGNASLILMGWLMVLLGIAAFAVVARSAVLSGYTPLTLNVTVDRSRLSGAWLLIAMAGIAVWLAAINSISGGATGTSGLLPWLIAMALMVVCWRRIDRARGVRFGVTMSRIEPLLLGGALIAMFAGQTFRLGDVPNSVWGDEGGYFSVARDIARGVFEPNVFGLGVYGFPMAGSIYQSIFIKLIGETITAWRLSSVVAVVLSALPLYFLVRGALGRRVAWLSLAAYAVLPYTLTFARMGYTLSLTLPVITTTIALLWIAVRRDSRLYAFLAGSVGGLGFFVHPSALLGLLLIVLYLIGLLLVRRWPGRSIFWFGAAATLGMIVVGGPIVAYGLAREPAAFTGKFVESAFNTVFFARDVFPEAMPSIGSFRVGPQEMFFDAGVYGSLLTRGALRTALSFHTSELLRDGYLVGALSEPFGIAMLIGLAWCLARWQRPGYALWPLWLLAGGCVLSVMSSYPPRAGLMVPIIPAMAVLSAIGLTASLDLLVGTLGDVPDRVRVIGLSGLMIVLALGGLRMYFSEMPDRFRPDLDDAMFWHAQSMPRNSAVVLVAADAADDYQPWGLREFDLGVAFNLIRPDALASNATRVICANGCAIFYRAAETDRIVATLRQLFESGTSVPYLAADGAAQFYRFVP